MNQRSRLIRKSVRCYLCGLASLIPVFGLLFGGLAVWLYAEVCRLGERQWNPAGRYAKAGVILAGFGIGFTCLLFILLIILLALPK